MGKYNPINFILPTTVNINRELFNEEFCTDKIRLTTLYEAKKISKELRKKYATDFSVAKIEDDLIDNSSFEKPMQYLVYPERKVAYAVNSNGEIIKTKYEINGVAVRFNLALPEDVNPKNIDERLGKVKNVKIDNKDIYLIELGQYPKTKVNKETTDLLNNLFNNGQLKEGLTCTGKLFSLVDDCNSYYIPEFEYNDEKFVRMVTESAVKWYKVEPVDFQIENYKQFKRKKAISLELESNDAILMCDAQSPNNNYYRWATSNLRPFLNSTNTNNLDGISSFYTNNGFFLDFSNQGFLCEALDNNRKATVNFKISQSIKEITEHAFDGCVGIEDLEIPQTVVCANKTAFDNCNFKYVYIKQTDTHSLHFSKNMPTCKISAVADIELLQKAYKDFSLEELVGSKNYIEILNLAQILVKNKIILPFCFVKNMAITNVIGDFINGEFKHFKGEPMLDLTKNSVYNELTDNQIINYYTLLTSMGCFSNDKITDKQGRPTAAELAQQAISVMAQILKEEKYKYFVFSQNLSTVAHTKPSQEFLKFVSQYENELNPLTGKMEKRFFNIETLLSLEKSCPAIISTVIHNFSDIKERRSTINNKGVPVTVPWEKAIESYYLQTQYNSPLKTEQDAKIAKLFIANSIPEEIFTKTKELFAYAADKEIQPHILHKPLKETTIADEIRVIQNDTVLMLQNGKELIEKLYKKQFTYEMLAKNDPRNAIIGKYASCCCNIGGEIYGNNIAEATITAKDVQNLVINDINGNIIGKATIYVNETKGYAVINEFDINVLYKEHEVKENDGGYYLNPTPKQMQERQRIFDAFMRGIHSFVEEYDKLHPNKPIEKVNVGIGHNRLKTQCRRYILASKNLSVPLSYKFLDAENEQRTLYDRFNPVIINSEDEKLLNDCIKG